ncbi:MAG: helicase HerA-like domain-containing protein, partial [Smithella sp.]
LLFNDAPAALLEKIEQMVRLIRSKGVGVYFVTQNPLDIPQSVLGQLGNRVQHALRAFTPRDQKAVKTAAETMRPNPAFNTADMITQLGVGEALISFLDEKGRPTEVEKSFVVAPCSRLGVLSDAERSAAVNRSTIYGHYEKTMDRESAYEKLQASVKSVPAPEKPAAPAGVGQAPEPKGGGILGGAVGDLLFGRTGPRGGKTDGLVQASAKSLARTIGSSIGRQIVRGILGSLLGGKK